MTIKLKIMFNLKKCFVLFLTCSLIMPSYADQIDVNGIRWPIPEWNISLAKNDQMQTQQCQNFTKFSTNSKKFLTEGLVIIKDGSLVFEYYDSYYTHRTPHILWSVSKTITGALLGQAVEDKRISLDDKLNDFYPRPDATYQDIQIKNLFYLDTGFIWDEFYSGDVKKSPVLNMLYGDGHRDIAEYASSKKVIEKGPGYKWNYTTGTPAITMGVLKQVYGQEYDEMPWKNFFDRIGMSNVHFERDPVGVFNGGSSAFATPRDMARIGYLYLNNGLWNGEEILSKDWIYKTMQVSPGYESAGTVIRDITDDGVYGGSVWLNKKVKSGFGKPYPTLPDDMYMALGHYGQMVIVLPSQKMVIARTGYDQEYNSKLDEFVSRALSCFYDPNYPIGKNIPPPEYSRTTLPIIFNTLRSGLQTNLIQAAVSKTLCSCHFISGLDLNTCTTRSNIPLAKYLTKATKDNNSISVEQSALAKLFVKVFGLKSHHSVSASFDINHPEFGCTLD